MTGGERQRVRDELAAALSSEGLAQVIDVELLVEAVEAALQPGCLCSYREAITQRGGDFWCPVHDPPIDVSQLAAQDPLPGAA